MLSFDDAYIDHFVNVFPILDECKIQGCFFPPVKAIMEHQVLDVNKIHFILASITNIQDLIEDIYRCLDRYRAVNQLESNKYYFDKLAVAGRFDCKEVIFVKRLLQVELEENLRSCITDILFRKYVSNDEESFSRELYMSIDQIKCMVRNGMYVGSHGYDHFWLDRLSSEQQEAEIDKSIAFLNLIGTPTDAWAMCYPYGAYNQSLVELLKRKNCKIGLTTQVGIANIEMETAFTLARLDTNDLPKCDNGVIAEWTKRAFAL